MSHIIMIAEIGENHIGDMGIARDLIGKAKDAGADYAKFQSYKPENFKQDDPEYGWFKKVSLSNEAHFMLKEHAEKLGIRFLSSPFSVERAKFLIEDLGLKEIKIASGVMLNFSMLDYVNNRAETVFLSTGLSSLDEIKKALEHLKDVPSKYILHCVTQYPASDKDANLNAVLKLKENFPGHPIGYSDHTVGIEACLIAAALGAEVIEKHFTFDKNEREGTDHIFSVEPKELESMIRSVRRIEMLLGKKKKEPALGEQNIKDIIRSRFV